MSEIRTVTFNRFVGDEVDRLTAFEEFAKLPQTGKKEFAMFLIGKAAEARPRRELTAAQWVQEESGKRVRKVISEVLQFEFSPSLAQVRDVWRRLYPEVTAMKYDCPQCHGTGFVQTEGPLGLSSATVCRHDGTETGGLRLNPAMTRRYLAEQAEADARRIAFLKRRATGDVKGFQRASQQDVDNLIAELGVEA